MTTYTKLDSATILPFLFHPRVEPPTDPPEGACNIEIETSEDVSLGCRFYIHSKSSPTILYFHGNGEITTDHDWIAPFYLKQGWNLLVSSYRGYGWSSGTPKGSHLIEDSRKVFIKTKDYLQQNNYEGPLFVMGRSLGSACALEVMSNHEDDLKGIILESGFGETIPLLQSLGAHIDTDDFTEEQGFRNLEKISKITKPTLILHGSLDQIIPVSSAERLQSHGGARNKQFHVIPGADHNSMISVGGELYFLTIKKFIDDITGASCWRRKRKAHKNNK